MFPPLLFRAIKVPGYQGTTVDGKFGAMVQQCFARDTCIMHDLQVDVHQPVSDHRKARCTGTALQVAAGLIDTGVATASCTTRLMLFVGGPCTEGAQSCHTEHAPPEIHFWSVPTSVVP